MNQCSKPGCAHASAVLLAYDYAARRAFLDDVAAGVLSPHLYPLCLPCAERLTPPIGWVLEDRRIRSRVFIPDRPDHNRSDQLAVLDGQVATGI